MFRIENKIWILLLTMLVTYSSPANAADIRLNWRIPDDPRVAGYRVYCGATDTDFTASPHTTIYSPDSTSCTFSDLERGCEYGFAVTSMDSEGNESELSEIVTFYLEPLENINENSGNEEDNNDTDSIEDGGESNDQDYEESDQDGLTEDKPSEILETGEIEINPEWRFISFEKQFTNPVVVPGPLSLNNREQIVVRVRNITRTGFEISIQAREAIEGEISERAGYIVMEAGCHLLPDGIHVEAGFQEINGAAAVDFDLTFQEIPVVLSTIVTENEDVLLTNRIYEVSTEGFGVVLQGEEIDQNNQTWTESISYIACEPSSGMLDNMVYEVDRSREEVTDELHSILFDQVFPTAPVFLAEIQTFNESNPSTIRMNDKDHIGADILIDDILPPDDDSDHNAEVVGFMAFSEETEPVPTTNSGSSSGSSCFIRTLIF